METYEEFMKNNAENSLNEQISIEQKESVKLIKNSRGYNWEIKLLEIDLKRLEELNKELDLKFGKKEE